MKNIFLGVVGIFIIFIAFQSARIYRPANIHMVEIGGQRIVVDVANTNEQRTQGLSGRSELKEDEGMLFVFESSGWYSFWMKDMNFPIDIIWLDEDQKIVYIKKDAQPESFPEIYISDENAKYILEVIAGFSEKNNLKVGDEVGFVY